MVGRFEGGGESVSLRFGRATPLIHAEGYGERGEAACLSVVRTVDGDCINATNGSKCSD